MANKPKIDAAVEKAALNEPQTVSSRVKLGEIGYTGLKVFDGISQEELNKELRFPESIKTYKKMNQHPAVAAPLTLYNSMVSKAKFRVLPPKDATADELDKTEKVNQMLTDMEIPLEDVIVDAMSMATFGFSCFEKVYRRRTKSAGSMYDDGVIGIRKLAFRNQESIEKFVFSGDGNEVIGLEQDLSGLSDPYGRYRSRVDTRIFIPRNKFLLFNLGRNRSDPYGTSPLRDVYLHWKMLTYFEELEAAGAAKDLQGVPLLKVPAQYMTADATPDQKAMFEQFKSIVRNLQQNTQSGVVLPSTVDEVTKEALFSLQLLSSDGGKKSYDITKIKEYYRSMIFIGMSADVLLMGNSTTGSFALGNIKSSLSGSFVESMLKRMIHILNEDLVRQIYQLNNWDESRRCTIDYEGYEEHDLESLSKMVQRIASVGFLPRTHEVINKILASMGVDPLVGDENLDDILTTKTSRAGDGMAKGSGNGTSDSVAGTDGSSLNMDNAA